VRAALDSGAFDTFHFPDGMSARRCRRNFGAEINGSIGQNPGPTAKARTRYVEIIAATAGFDRDLALLAREPMTPRR
jgi:branched-chain amino acid transport system substrate-binding protein